MKLFKFFGKRGFATLTSLAHSASLIAPALAASFTDLNNAINDTNTERQFYGGVDGSVQGAIEAWTENGVRNVTLNGTVTNSGNESSIQIGSGKNVNLDLNGYDINNNNQGSTTSTIWVNGGTLTLDDHSNDTDSSATVGKVTGGTGSGIFVEGGMLIMNDGEISGNRSKSGSHGGGVHVNNAGSSFTMNGGAITGNTADGQGGGVFVQNGTFTMSGGAITGNTAKWGGGVNTVGGTVNMTSGTIGSNRAEKDGSDVWVKNNGGKNASFTMSGSSAINGSAAADGQHTVAVEGNSTFTMNGNATVRSSDSAAADILAKAGSTVNYSRDDNGGLRVVTNTPDDGAGLLTDVTVDEDTDLNIEYPEPGTPGGGAGGTGEVTIDEPAVPLASGPVTRAEFIDYLWRHENEPDSEGVCTFEDVEATHEYFDALCWADENGVAEAYFNVEGHEDGTFEPDELVTVGAVREFLDNFARVFGMDVDVYALTTLTGDEDEAVLNCDEVLAEFFGEEYIPAMDEDAAA